MIGVAQVIGMKPTFSLVRSGLPAPCARISVAVCSGKNCDSAASAVEAPTYLQERAARGVLAGTSPASPRRRRRPRSACSSLVRCLACTASVAESCALWLAWRPQVQPVRRRFGSNGVSNVPMADVLSCVGHWCVRSGRAAPCEAGARSCRSGAAHAATPVAAEVL